MSPIQRPTRDDVLVFPTPADFRAWLEANHDRVPDAFIGYYRKGVGKRAMTYAEAVEQALCFGWIDGITYRVDEEVTATRFTPRQRGSYWSAVNIGKVERLIEAGLMTPAGLKAYEARDRSAEARYSYENRPADLPAPMLERLRANADASAHWDAQSASYRRTVAFWVTSAKQEATRQRRLDRLIADSAAGRLVGPMSYGREGRDR